MARVPVYLAPEIMQRPLVVVNVAVSDNGKTETIARQVIVISSRYATQPSARHSAFAIGKSAHDALVLPLA